MSLKQVKSSQTGHLITVTLYNFKTIFMDTNYSPRMYVEIAINKMCCFVYTVVLVSEKTTTVKNSHIVNICPKKVEKQNTRNIFDFGMHYPIYLWLNVK